MPRIQFPNVPNVPGVPQLLRQLPAAPPTIVANLAGIGSLVHAFTSTSVWGIFAHLKPLQTSTPDGIPETTLVSKRIPVVTPDSYLEFDYTQDWTVSTAPTQQGGFADYNRVASPFEIKLRMFKGGSFDVKNFINQDGARTTSSFLDQGVQARSAFLKQIEDLGTTKLYDIFTPEKHYLNCNFIRSEISRRGEKGAYQLSMVDVYFREIREVVPAYSKTVIAAPKNPSATQQQNNGTQQGAVTTATPAPSVIQ